jgi:hypothetical protein
VTEPVRFSSRQGHLEWALRTAALSHVQPHDRGLARMTGRHHVEPAISLVLMSRSNADQLFRLRPLTSVEQGMAKPTSLVPGEESLKGVLLVAPVQATEGQDHLLTPESRLDIDAEVLVLPTGGANLCHITKRHFPSSRVIAESREDVREFSMATVACPAERVAAVEFVLDERICSEI